MSGHSKWANIQHRKNAQDKMKNKVITKICREITIASRLGGGLPENNPRLKAAIVAAKKNSVPAKNIENAIKKGTGEIESENLDTVIYEGYGPEGIAIYVETSTDNRNRTVSEVRSAFTKCGGQLGENGVVAWMFDQKGCITVHKSHYSVEEDLFELILESGAEDLKSDDDYYYIYTKYDELFDVKDSLEKLSVVIESAELVMLPKTINKVEDEESALKLLKLIDKLNDLDDVMKVYANFDLDSEMMNKLEDKIE